MLYLVQAQASIERGNEIDAKGGPAPIFAHIAQRFRPQSFYGNPARRQVFLIVDLPTPADVAELMYILTWSTATEPTFTPLMSPDQYAAAIEAAKKAPTI